MSRPAETALAGADPDVVREALAAGDPLPGTAGFAGALDGCLVRDVLGRHPLFSASGDPSNWSHDHADLADPERVPAGHVRTPTGDERVWSLPDPEPRSDTGRAVGPLRDAIDAAVDGIDTGGLAVAFSGGLDSALLAARLDGPLYAAGFPGSHDLAAARSGARALGRNVRTVELDHGLLEATVPRVARAPEDTRVAADTVRGAHREVLGTVPDQIERDTLALRAAGLDPVIPLLADRLVAAALRLPGEALVSPRGERKWAFRLAARKWVPDRLAFREKTALQYGTLAARELDRLARQAGFKRRVDDHVSRYVESLL